MGLARHFYFRLELAYHKAMEGFVFYCLPEFFVEPIQQFIEANYPFEGVAQFCFQFLFLLLIYLARLMACVCMRDQGFETPLI